MAKLEILQGTLDGMILKTLSWGPLHGYGVARWLKNTSDEVFQIDEGALYPALHRMERKGWVEAEWGVSENNRRAKYYRITEKGRTALKSEFTSWTMYAAAVAKVFEAPAPEEQ